MTEEMNLAVFDPIRAITAEIIKKDECQVFDHTTDDGEKELRSWVYRIRGHRSDLEKIRVAAKSEALTYGKKVDALAKELKTPFDKIIAERMKPLDEIEAKKRAEAGAQLEVERLAAEKVEKERLADLERREAEMAAKEAEQKAKQDEADLTELNRLADIQHEADKLAAVEAAKAKAEQDAKDAAELAEHEKAKAVEAEKEKARQVERDKLTKETAELVEKDRIALVERKRVADVEHRKQVEQGVIDAIVISLGLDSDSVAQEIVDAIVSGEIPNVTINY